MEFFWGKEKRPYVPRMQVDWMTEDEKDEYRGIIEVYQNTFVTLEQATAEMHDDPVSLLSEKEHEVVTKYADSDNPESIINFARSQYNSIFDEYIDKLVLMAPHCLYAFHEAMNPHEIPSAAHHKLFIDNLMEIDAGRLATLLIAASAGSSKPVALDTPVLMSDNTYKPISEIEVGEEVISHTGRTCRITRVHEQPQQEAVKFTFSDGDEIVSAPDHTHFTARGMVQTKDVVVGDNFAKLSGIKQSVLPPEASRELKLAVLMGLMVGDGYMKGKQYAFFSGDPVVIELFQSFYQDCFGGPRLYQLTDKRTGCERVTLRKDLMNVLDNVGISGKTSAHKEAPMDWLDNEVKIWGYLAGHFMADGCLSIQPRPKPRKVFAASGEISTISGAMCGQLAKLFGLIGIQAHTYRFPIKYTYKDASEKHEFAYKTIIKRKEGICRFFQSAPIVGKKRETYREAVEEGHLRPTHDAEHYVNIEVKRIESAPVQDMRCLTIEHDHTFVTKACITHNTTYSSRSFAQWWIGRNPSKRILAAGNTQKFIEKEISAPNRNAMETETYGRIFPDVALDPKSSGSDFWRIRYNTGSYKCVGAEGAVAGVRADMFLLDDLFPQAAAAQQQGQRNKVKRWLAADILSRMKPGIKLVMVNTIFHSEDAMSYMIEQVQKQQETGQEILPSPTRFIRLPAQCDDEENDALGRKEGEYIWPEFYPESHWTTLKAQLTAMEWSCIYQNQPADVIGDNLAEADFHYYDRYPDANGNGKPDDYLKTVATVDCAMRATERSDYSVVTVFRQHIDKTWYVLAVWREQKGLSDIAEAVMAMAKQWGLNYVVVEGAGMGFQLLDEYQGKLGVPLIEYTPQGKGSKAFRADKIWPYIKTKRILFPDAQPWMQEVKKELIGFPNASYDDIVDTFSILVDQEFSFTGGGTKKLVQSIRKQNNGRS